MTEPMELVGLVEQRIGQDFDGECHLTADEARKIAACIREMVERLEMLEAELEVANLPPAPGAEA